MKPAKQNFFLYLMRHGEALHTCSNDHARPLTEKGKQDSRHTGARIMSTFGQVGMFPQAFLVSSAMRTRETAECLSLVPPPPLHISERLYHGSMQDYLDEIHQQDVASLLVIGHNPSILQLLHLLCLPDLSMPELPLSFPPAALAVLEFSTSCQQCSPRTGRLCAFILP